MPRHRSRGKTIKIPGTWEFLCSHVRWGWAESNLQQLVRLFNTLVHHIAQRRQPTLPSAPCIPHRSGFCSARANWMNLQRFCKQQPLSLAPLQAFQVSGKMGRSAKCLTQLFGKGKCISPIPHRNQYSQWLSSWGPAVIFKSPFVKYSGPFLTTLLFLRSNPDFLEGNNLWQVCCSATQYPGSISLIRGPGGRSTHSLEISNICTIPHLI